jgi:hypothetical protein
LVSLSHEAGKLFSLRLRLRPLGPSLWMQGKVAFLVSEVSNIMLKTFGSDRGEYIKMLWRAGYEVRALLLYGQA